MTLLDPRYTTLDGPFAGRLKSCGQVALGCEIKVVDANREEVPRGTAGELAIRGANIMKGYWNKPAETAAVLKDGWYYSGDGAYMDDQGFVFIVDRLKDMIISGGENVYSAEVENAISLLTGVSEVAVIGVPDERWGERVHAIIVPKPGVTLNADDVMEHCRGQIAGYKCPRSIDFRDTALPLSGAGKVLKRELREALLEGLHQGGELAERCSLVCGKISDCRKLSTNQTARNARHSSAKLLNLKKNSAMPKAIRNGTASCLAATRRPRSLMSENTVSPVFKAMRH